MICEFCGSEYLLDKSGSTSRFCSLSCIGKYANISRKIKAMDAAKLKYKMLAKNPKLHPRDIGGSYGTAADIVCRANPLRPFLHKNFNDDIRKSIVRRYVDNKDIINSIVHLSKIYNTTGLMSSFLMYVVNNFPHIAKKLSELYETMNTWEIAKLFGLDQRVICRIYGINGLNITSRSMRCSKIHLKMKPIIEDILGVKTETEHYINGYWIDEFSIDLNLCIEIDGKWCHNKEYDKIRDDKLRSLGFDVVRIPAYSNYDEINSYLSQYKRT